LVFRDLTENITLLANGISRTHNRRDYPDKWNMRRLSIFNQGMKIASGFRKLNRILDVGSGEGFFLSLCLANGWEVFGVEVNSELIKFTEEKVNIKVFNGPLEDARFPENHFDVVTFWNVLEHLSEPDTVLRETYRILRPGGGILVRFPNATFHVNCRRVFVKVYKFWKGIKRFHYSVIHSYSFSLSTISKYLKNAGFRFYEVQNWQLRRLSKNTQVLPVTGIFEFAVKCSIKISKMVTMGRCSIAPSLIVKGIKPLE
jgi:2-polyprenyl-3-methyl-5-hydroxy-6-metoxy-1,4-benzoquinol methylase